VRTEARLYRQYRICADTSPSARTRNFILFYLLIIFFLVRANKSTSVQTQARPSGRGKKLKLKIKKLKFLSILVDRSVSAQTGVTSVRTQARPRGSEKIKIKKNSCPRGRKHVHTDGIYYLQINPHLWGNCGRTMDADVRTKWTSGRYFLP
jgi:hypothetical protein